MKLYVNLDKDGYVLSVCSNELEGMPSIDSGDYDFSGCRLSAYRWNGKALVLDEDRLAELEQEEQEQEKETEIWELTRLLRESDSVVLEALESILSATTLTALLSALVSAAKSIKATLTERNNIRERIRDLGGK